MQTSKATRLGTVILACLVLIVFILAALAIRSTHFPNGKDTYCQKDNTGHEDCAAYDATTVLLWQIEKTFEDHTGAISALSGVAVAVFTGTLWWVTLGMVRIAEKQRADTLRAIQAAETASSASIRQADAAERTLSTLERAYVFVHRFEGNLWPLERIAGPGTPWMQPHGNLFLVNRGRTPAIITGFFTHVVLGNSPTMPNESLIDEGMGQLVLTNGEPGAGPVPFQYADVVTDEDICLINAGKRSIFIICRIRYEDIFGIEHFRGVAVVYNHHSRIFITSGGKAYNYDRLVRDDERRKHQSEQV